MKRVTKKIKQVILALVVVGGSFSANAQVFEEGTSFASLGYGFPNLNGALFTLYEANPGFEKSSFGPIHARFEYGITDKLGIGVSMNYTSAKVSWDYDSYDDNNNPVVYKEGWNTMSFNTLIRLNWHFVESDKVDFYSGFGLGYNYAKYDWTTTDPNYSDDGSITELANIIPIGYEATLGLRYLFTDNIGAYMELGWSKSLIQVGAVMKF